MHIWTHRACGRMHRVCIVPSQMASQHWEGEVDMISNWQQLSNENLFFSNGVSLGTKLHSKTGPMPSSSWPTQNEHNGIGDFFFCLMLLNVGIFFLSLTGLLFIYIMVSDFVVFCLGMCLSMCMCFFCIFYSWSHTWSDFTNILTCCILRQYTLSSLIPTHCNTSSQ